MKTDQVDRNRVADEPGYHRLSGHEIHQADAKRMGTIGWLAVGVMAHVTLVVLVYVMNPRRGPGGGSLPREHLLELRDKIMQVDVNDAKAVKEARECANSREIRALWKGEFIENDIVSKLRQLDEAFEKNVKVESLLDMPGGWQEAIESASFKISFGSQGLTLTNEEGEGASPGGVRYLPGTS